MTYTEVIKFEPVQDGKDSVIPRWKPKLLKKNFWAVFSRTDKLMILMGKAETYGYSHGKITVQTPERELFQDLDFHVRRLNADMFLCHGRKLTELYPPPNAN